MWCQANLPLKLNSALRHERNNNFVKTKQCASIIFLPYSLCKKSERKNGCFMLNLQSWVGGKKYVKMLPGPLFFNLMMNPLRCPPQMVSYYGSSHKSPYVFPWYNPCKPHVTVLQRDLGFIDCMPRVSCSLELRDTVIF